MRERKEIEEETGRFPHWSDDRVLLEVLLDIREQNQQAINMAFSIKRWMISVVILVLSVISISFW